MTPRGEAPSSAAARPLGALSLLALGANGVVGVGIFFLPAELAALWSGPSAALVFPLTALLLAPVAVCVGKLGAALPEDGGPYLWARRAFGRRVAFLVGWVAWVSALLSTGAVLSGLTEHSGALIGLEPGVGRRVGGFALALSLGAVALSGLLPSARVWSLLTALKLVPLLALVAVGLAAEPAEVAVTGLQTGAAPDARMLARAVLLASFTLQGFEIVAVPAGKVRDPRRAIPVAALGALLGAAVLYAALYLVAARSLPGLAGVGAPLVEAGRAVGGAFLAALLAVGAQVSALGIAFGMVVMTPRYLAALSAERAVGDWAGRESAGVPRGALLASLGVVVVLQQLGSVGELFALSALAVALQFAVTAAALLVLAVRRTSPLRPRDGWPAPLAAGGVGAVALGATGREALALLGFLLVGAALQRWRRGDDEQPPARPP